MALEKRDAVIRAMTRSYTDRVTVNQETARAALIAKGIYTTEGVLRREFGAPGKQVKPTTWAATPPAAPRRAE